MQREQRKKLWIGIIVGVIVSIVTLFALFIILILFVVTGGPAKTTTNIRKYAKSISKYEYIPSAFIVFPEQIPESAQDTDFYFYFKDLWDMPGCEVFLQCTYDEGDYQKEIERLENTSKFYGSVERKFLRDEEERFQYPAYIAVDGHNDAYEYALLSEERQITYIFTSYKMEAKLKKIESKYLPSDFDSKQEQLDFGEGYSIYLIDENRSSQHYDYTRDKHAVVESNYRVNFGGNSFEVCTHLDENDNKIIQYCTYVYYDDLLDQVYGNFEEIRYLELKGYRFKSIRRSTDNDKKAVVTYYDGDKEKTMEYEIPEISTSSNE